MAGDNRRWGQRLPPSNIEASNQLFLAEAVSWTATFSYVSELLQPQLNLMTFIHPAQR